MAGAGAFVGANGPNGAGKPMPFKMIVGQEKPATGAMRLGEIVQIAYADQPRADLDPDKNFYQGISDDMDNVQLGKVLVNGRADCSRFAFSGTAQAKKVYEVSRGERNRCTRHPRSDTACDRVLSKAGVMSDGALS